jgi:hypothetical protein
MHPRETICIVKAPGVTERKAIALARARLEMRGMAPAEVPRPLAELVDLSNNAVKVWQVSFVVPAAHHERGLRPSGVGRSGPT